MVDLSRLGKKSFVSQSALSQVLADLRNAEELPSACSRQSIKRARVAAIGDLTPFGSVVKEWSVETKTGGQKNVTYVCPAAMLHFTAQKCPGWSAALKLLLSQKTSTPASPYRLILYADEISPGNVLKADNRRKVFAIYWAIAESRMHIQPTFMRVSIYQHSFWNPLSTRFVRMCVLRNLAAACCQPNHLGSS